MTYKLSSATPWTVPRRPQIEQQQCFKTPSWGESSGLYFSPKSQGPSLKRIIPGASSQETWQLMTVYLLLHLINWKKCRASVCALQLNIAGEIGDVRDGVELMNQLLEPVAEKDLFGPLTSLQFTTSWTFPKKFNSFGLRQKQRGGNREPRTRIFLFGHISLQKYKLRSQNIHQVCVCQNIHQVYSNIIFEGEQNKSAAQPPPGRNSTKLPTLSLILNMPYARTGLSESRNIPRTHIEL